MKKCVLSALFILSCCLCVNAAEDIAVVDLNRIVENSAQVKKGLAE